MACRIWILGAALLLFVALFDSMGSAEGALTLKDLMLKDQDAKRHAVSPVPLGVPEKPHKKHKKNKKHPKGDASKKKAAPAYAQHQATEPLQAPMMAGGGSGSTGQGAALGTSALIGIGVGVGVACLVAVGAVVGVLVHLRRKRKGAQLEKQKTYGGTE